MKDGYMRNLIANYFAPAYRWGWWSVAFWVVALVFAAMMAWYEV